MSEKFEQMTREHTDVERINALNIKLADAKAIIKAQLDAENYDAAAIKALSEFATAFCEVQVVLCRKRPLTIKPEEIQRLLTEEETE